ncbi:MAG: EamA family transporter [Desulfuromonas sp.]|nr:MAG: EamA family transporter [Desulfuromonas sp.]
MNNIIKSHCMVLLATVLVAGSFLASARLAGVINPFSLTLMRFVASSLLLLPLVLSRHDWRRKIVPILPRALGISLFYALFFVCLFEALKTTTSLNTGTLYTLVPFMTALLCLLLLGQKIGRTTLLIYLLGAAAACWVIFEGRLDRLLAFSLNDGDWLFLVGTVLICGYSLAMKLLYRPGDPMVVLVFGILLGGAGWMALAMVVLDQPLNWQQIHGHHLWAMAYLVVASTLLTVYLYQRSTVILGPRRVMAYVYLNPAAVALLSWQFDHTTIEPVIIPGIVLCSLATLLLQREPQKS